MRKYKAAGKYEEKESPIKNAKCPLFQRLDDLPELRDIMRQILSIGKEENVIDNISRIVSDEKTISLNSARIMFNQWRLGNPSGSRNILTSEKSYLDRFRQLATFLHAYGIPKDDQRILSISKKLGDVNFRYPSFYY